MYQSKTDIFYLPQKYSDDYRVLTQHFVRNIEFDEDPRMELIFPIIIDILTGCDKKKVVFMRKEFSNSADPIVLQNYIIQKNDDMFKNYYYIHNEIAKFSKSKNRDITKLFYENTASNFDDTYN
jgi:hypothetical protein